MELVAAQFGIRKNWIYILPAIEIDVNDQRYRTKNFAICVHFLVFHARFMWRKKNDKPGAIFKPVR